MRCTCQSQPEYRPADRNWAGRGVTHVSTICIYRPAARPMLALCLLAHRRPHALNAWYKTGRMNEYTPRVAYNYATSSIWSRCHLACPEIEAEREEKRSEWLWARVRAHVVIPYLRALTSPLSPLMRARYLLTSSYSRTGFDDE